MRIENFLVIAYKQMREIEAEINRRRDELHLRSEIPLTNFRGIELRDFPAEIARLALIIAEFSVTCSIAVRRMRLPNSCPWMRTGSCVGTRCVWTG